MSDQSRSKRTVDRLMADLVIALGTRKLASAAVIVRALNAWHQHEAEYCGVQTFIDAIPEMPAPLRAELEQWQAAALRRTKVAQHRRSMN